jgi:hypothetical protein
VLISVHYQCFDGYNSFEASVSAQGLAEKALSRCCVCWGCGLRSRGRGLAEGDENGKVQLSYEELALLVGGIELGRTRRKNWYGREESLRAENVEENAGN